MKSGLACGGILGVGMVADLTWLLAPVLGSRLVRQRSRHDSEVWLGLGIIFMYNMSILEAFWEWGWWLPSHMMMVSNISKRLLRDEAQFHELPVKQQ